MLKYLYCIEYCIVLYHVNDKITELIIFIIDNEQAGLKYKICQVLGTGVDKIINISCATMDTFTLG